MADFDKMRLNSPGIGKGAGLYKLLEVLLSPATEAVEKESARQLEKGKTAWKEGKTLEPLVRYGTSFGLNLVKPDPLNLILAATTGVSGASSLSRAAKAAKITPSLKIYRAAGSTRPQATIAEQQLADLFTPYVEHLRDPDLRIGVTEDLLSIFPQHASVNALGIYSPSSKVAYIRPRPKGYATNTEIGDLKHEIGHHLSISKPGISSKKISLVGERVKNKYPDLYNDMIKRWQLDPNDSKTPGRVGEEYIAEAFSTIKLFPGDIGVRLKNPSFISRARSIINDSLRSLGVDAQMSSGEVGILFDNMRRRIVPSHMRELKEGVSTPIGAALIKAIAETKRDSSK